MTKIASAAATEGAVRKIGALLGAVVFTLGLLSGCGDDSSADGNSSANANATGTSSEQEPDDDDASDEDASGDGLPEDFPADVPLPEFDSARKIGGESGPEVSHDWWSVMLMLKNPTETPVEDYVAQLSDAGYTVSTDSGITEAVGEKWEIQVRSSMVNTLTLGVMTK